MTPERREAIVRLLRTRDEHLPEPGHVRSQGTAGFVHHTLAPRVCDVCDGVESLKCTGCGGRGWVERKRERDPYATDAVVPYGLDGTRHEQARERDRQIDVLAQQLRPASNVDELADANAHPYLWERARKRMYQLYDYGALDQALEQLRVVDDGASRALHAVYVYGWQSEPSTGPLRAACDRGLAFLAGRLPDPLRLPPEKKDVENTAARGRGADPRALSQRDTAIVRAIDGGAPTEHVASSFNLSVSQINKIVRSTAA